MPWTWVSNSLWHSKPTECLPACPRAAQLSLSRGSGGLPALLCRWCSHGRPSISTRACLRCSRSRHRSANSKISACLGCQDARIEEHPAGESSLRDFKDVYSWTGDEKGRRSSGAPRDPVALPPRKRVPKVRLATVVPPRSTAKPLQSIGAAMCRMVAARVLIVHCTSLAGRAQQQRHGLGARDHAAQQAGVCNTISLPHAEQKSRLCLALRLAQSSKCMPAGSKGSAHADAQHHGQRRLVWRAPQPAGCDARDSPAQLRVAWTASCLNSKLVRHIVFARRSIDSGSSIHPCTATPGLTTRLFPMQALQQAQSRSFSSCCRIHYTSAAAAATQQPA